MQNIELAAKIETALRNLELAEVAVYDLNEARAALRDAMTMVQSVAAPVATKSVKTAKPRCCHYATIRTFFARSMERGLNVKDSEGMRAAMSQYLGREVQSRSELSGAQWGLLCEAVERKVLSW